MPTIAVLVAASCVNVALVAMLWRLACGQKRRQ
jgi:hypothetical protein